MRVAFTMDDLPLYPHLGLPESYTPASVAESIIEGLGRHKVEGVYAFANSWPLDVDPQTETIFDTWTSAGHFVGNHSSEQTCSTNFISILCARILGMQAQAGDSGLSSDYALFGRG